MEVSFDYSAIDLFLCSDICMMVSEPEKVRRIAFSF